MTDKVKFEKFLKRFLTKLDTNKPFNIAFNKSQYYVSREMLDDLNQHKPKEGGFIPILGPLIDILFKRGSGCCIDDDEEHEGGFLGAIAAGLGKVLPYVLKGLKFLNPIAGIAGGISETVKNAKIANNVGNGIYLNPYKGKGLKEMLIPIVDKIDGVEEEGKKQIRKAIKTLTPFFKIYEDKEGNGIFLNPRL